MQKEFCEVKKIHYDALVTKTAQMFIEAEQKSDSV
jgi:hypothetical protein